MFCIKNSCINTSNSLNKPIAGFACVLAITAIAIAVSGLTASIGGPFNVIVGLGSTINGIFLGTSIFALILDLVWIAALHKRSAQTFSSQTQDKIINASEKRLTPLKQFPHEINHQIFSYLTPAELARCMQVSKEWKVFASSKSLWNAFDCRYLRYFFPSIRIFNELDWATHFDLASLGISMEDAPLSDKRKEILALKRVLSSLPIEGNSGVTLLTIPKGLTLNKLIKLARSPKLGNAVNLGYIWNRISEEIGNIPVDKTYRIVITNNIFIESRDLSVSAQKNLVRKMGCEMPKILEAAALLVVTYTSFWQRLYHNKPWTYTCCSEQVDGQQLIIGGFAPCGPTIFSSNIDSDQRGVGGVLWKFL